MFTISLYANCFSRYGNLFILVSVERNRKEAMIVVDGSQKAEVREPPGPVRAIHLTSDLVIGASTDYR